MATVRDRWHKTHPKPGERRCSEHRGLVPSAEHGAGKRWQVRYVEGTTVVKENFAVKAVAEQRRNEVASLLDRGHLIHSAEGRAKFSEVANAYLASGRRRDHRESTSANVGSTLRIHVLPTFAEMRVGSIRRADIQRWADERAEALAPSTLRVKFGDLSSIFKWAVIEGYIATNPCLGVELPKVRAGEVVPLRREVVEALIEAAPAHLANMLTTAAATGLRQGELFGLEPIHIDEDARTIQVVQQLRYSEAHRCWEIAAPKTENSARLVPYGETVATALKQRAEAYAPVPLEVLDTTGRKPRQRIAHLVFTGRERGPISRGSWSLVWDKLVKAADALLVERESRLRVPDDATLHDFRDFYASVLIAGGASVKVVQRRLGHSKPSITLDTYTGLWDNAPDTTADVVDAVLLPGKRPASATVEE